MRLLIITQKVDMHDGVLGFMHGWVEEFARQFEKVIVICLEEGEHQLPKNVRVLSLGKEQGRSRLRALRRFYIYIWRERKDYDAVFVHMTQIYVLLGGILWRVLGKKVSLWYAHGHVPFSLKVAAPLTHIILTSTQSGCRLRSKKVHVIGQGIDTRRFRGVDSRLPSSAFRIVSVGRISPVKAYETLIEAAEQLIAKGLDMRVTIVGGAGTPEQEPYVTKLKEDVRLKGLENVIRFAGVVPNKDILPYLHAADIFVNPSQTGSLDKAAAEAMAAQLPMLTSNEAFQEVLGQYTDSLMYERGSARALAEKIDWLAGLRPEERAKIGADLRGLITRNHSLEEFIKKMRALLEP
jgi:glycosyltransferase involved in cell wall biosynthesis